LSHLSALSHARIQHSESTSEGVADVQERTMEKQTGFSCKCGREFKSAKDFSDHLKRDGAQVLSCKK